MAGQVDVEAALADIIGTALYPEGSGAPSVLGRVVRVYRGWPVAAALDRDLAAGTVNISVFPDAHTQRNTTRWPDMQLVSAPVLPTLTVEVAGQSATFGGAAKLGQVAGLLVDNIAAVHRTAVGDTPQSVAAVIGAYLRGRRIVQVAGATVSVPGAARMTGRVVSDQSLLRELRRERQNFRVSCWCPDPDTRDATGVIVDAVLSARTFIGLPDGCVGRIRFVSAATLDQAQNASLYRRDLVYSVEYATTVIDVLPSMIFGDATLAPAGGDVAQSLVS